MCEVMRKYEEIAESRGIAQGKAEEKTNLAKKLIASCGFTDEQISDLTGLPVEEVTAIRNGSAA